jgi:putative ABC transport system permease protein
MIRGWIRLLPSALRERFGEEMEGEIRDLLDRARRDGGRAGWARAWVRIHLDVALEAARLRIGGLGRRYAPGGGGSSGGGWGADLRHAARTLRRRPLLSVTAILLLALGVAASASVFTISAPILFRPLPWEDPGALVVLYEENPALGWRRTDPSASNVLDWEERARVFREVAVYRAAGRNLTGGDRPERVSLVQTTPNLLSLLGATPALGRDLREEDARPGAPGVAILSHAFHLRALGGDPGVVGRTLHLEGEAVEVVGVAPEDFRFLERTPDLWIPFREDLRAVPRTSHSFSAIARLTPGVDVDAANVALRELQGRLRQEYPELEGWQPLAIPVRDDLAGGVSRQASLLLMGATGVLLLMACVNVANLLLARGAARRGELAVRAALGAGRGRIARLLMAEALLLGGIGGAAGILGAAWGSRALASALPPQVPAAFDFSMDAGVVLFAVAAALLAALGSGLVPALRCSRPVGDLRAAGRGGDGGMRRAGASLIVVQAALAVLLLAVGGVLGRSVVGMASRDLGFDSRNLLLLDAVPSTSAHPEGASVNAVHHRLLEAVREIPGVVAAGAIQAPPLGGSNWGTGFGLSGAVRAEPGSLTARLGYVTPGYFEAMGVRRVAGRGFEGSDGPEGERVGIVNEAFVRIHLGGADPLGVRVEGEQSILIVGVVADHLERAVDRPIEPALYLPLAQGPVRSRTLVVRTAGDPLSAYPLVQAAFLRVDPELPPFDPRTMEEVVRSRIASYGVLAWMMALAGGLSLLLGAVGIYGVTAYGVGRRRKEMAIRIALGAGAGRVVQGIVRGGVGRALLGAALGIAGAVPVLLMLEGVVVGMSPLDPVVLGGSVLLLVATAALGSWLPARRVGRLDPARTLAAD